MYLPMCFFTRGSVSTCQRPFAGARRGQSGGRMNIHLFCVGRHMFSVCLSAYVFITPNRLFHVKAVARTKPCSLPPIPIMMSRFFLFFFFLKAISRQSRAISPNTYVCVCVAFRHDSWSKSSARGLHLTAVQIYHLLYDIPQICPECF